MGYIPTFSIAAYSWNNEMIVEIFFPAERFHKALSARTLATACLKHASVEALQSPM